VSTYLLENLTPGMVERIQRMRPEVFEVRRARGILVSCLAPPEEVTARVLPGNNADVVQSWIERGIAEDLKDEYHRTKPSDDAREEAISGWKVARKERAESENALRRLNVERDRLLRRVKEAKEREYTASAELVRTHGRKSIMIDGCFWDMVSSGDTVFWKKSLLHRKKQPEKAGEQVEK